MSNSDHETLGRSVVPTNYKLEIEPGMKGFKFKGKVEITANAKAGTRLIRLNAKELRIRSAKVSSKGSEQSAAISLNKGKEELHLRLKSPAYGAIKIAIVYEGSHNDKLYGFYRSAYHYKKKTSHMFSTELEPADARAVLPCFDEPEFKATFDLSVLIDRKLDAISNNEIKSVANSGRSKKLVAFKTSPKMSTYLLYIGIGRFDYLNGRLGKLKLRVVTSPGKAQYGAVAIQYAKKLVHFYEKYFGIKYPLGKLDLIAVPDFPVGAMENWGAIAFRESELLWDKDRGSVASRQEVCSILAHEIAHQWFGDLVTMAWWDDIWLNESFASFLGQKSEDALFPGWNVMAQVILDPRTGMDMTLAQDQMAATHPIYSKVKSVDGIQRTFDRISYAKGMNFLVMLEDYVGERTFREGLHAYLKKNAYSNATRYDLWKAMDSAARKHGKGLGSTEVARPWVERPGYPIVTVYKSDWAVHLSQRRYTLTEKAPDRSETWPVPMHYITDSGASGSLLMRGTDRDLPIDSTAWLKINYGEKGIYRVRYPQEMLNAIGEAILKGKLGGIDSWGVENDLFALVRSARLPLTDYLNFVDSYCRQPKYPMSMSVSGHLGWLRAVCQGTKHEKAVARVSFGYHVELLSALGWRTRKGESSTDSILRGRVISELSNLGHAPTIRKIANLFGAYRKKGGSLDPNINSAVFGSIAWNGGEREYKMLVKMYEKERSLEVKRKLLAALGRFREDEIIKKALTFSMSKRVRLQDSYVIPTITSSTPEAREAILKWTMKNWRHFKSIYAPGTNFLDGFVLNLSANKDSESLETVTRFFSKKENRRPDIEGPISQVIEQIGANISFMKKNQQ